MTEASIQALKILRSPDHFGWYLIPMLVFVIYIYVVEAQKRNWDIVLTGLIYYALEWFWEILNALLLHFTNYSALWTAPKDTAYLITVGLNIEISMMFAVAGVIMCKLLPSDKNLKIFGISNRIVIPIGLGLVGVAVEALLNQWGALVWEYSFWRWPNLYLLVIAYVTPFYAMTWVYDKLPIIVKLRFLYIAVAVDIAAWIVFANILKWI